jgi:hypothetical protein
MSGKHKKTTLLRASLVEKEDCYNYEEDDEV